MKTEYIVVTAVIFGLFFVIPAQSFAEESSPITLTKSMKYTQPPKSYGSANSVVCGAQLCNAVNPGAPNVSNPEILKSYDITGKELALQKALENRRSMAILRDYWEYKGVDEGDAINHAMGYLTADEVSPKNSDDVSVQVPQDNTAKIMPENETTEIDVVPQDSETKSKPTDKTMELGLFANPDFYASEVKTTKMKEVSETTSYEVKLPPWIKSSYANPEHPEYVKPVQVEPVEIPTIETPVNGTMISANSTGIMPVNGTSTEKPVGICGEGTELIDGICKIIKGFVTEDTAEAS